MTSGPSELRLYLGLTSLHLGLTLTCTCAYCQVLEVLTASSPSVLYCAQLCGIGIASCRNPSHGCMRDRGAPFRSWLSQQLRRFEFVRTSSRCWGSARSWVGTTTVVSTPSTEATFTLLCITRRRRDWRIWKKTLPSISLFRLPPTPWGWTPRWSAMGRELHLHLGVESSLQLHRSFAYQQTPVPRP